ncbi:unnamed protein product [Schistosoma rodhaini]|uniref:Sulfotransferase domain-containing protein n=1 Tax=Schistosoma rodhaini TaxID=6188 RepID=A0AA85GHF5_9TREM|nr:unnamed protein product [Schistosoma rodhaini]
MSKASTTTINVIGAGLPRTGTSSLKMALEILFHQPCYHITETVTKNYYDIGRWQKLLNEVQKINLNETMIYEGLNEILNGYTSVTDIPACGFYKELMRVVLTIRDKNDWLSSLRQTIIPKTNHSHTLVVDKVKQILGLDEDFVKMAFDSLKFAFRKREIDFDDDTVLLECYDEYNEMVVDSVPSKRLLVHKLGDGWEPLCKFLNVNVPHCIPYPHINDRNETCIRVDLLKNIGIL